jgi:glycerol kinase
MNILAIDQGTSATKALVIAAPGHVLGEGQAPVTPRPGTAGAVTQSPQELLDSVLSAGRAAIAAAGAPVHGVGLGNQGETVLQWEPRTGRPLGEAVSWQDRRAEGLTRSMAEHAGRLRELTGLPLDPYFAAPKMAWLESQDRDDLGGVVTTVDTWLTHQLTGEFVTDAATASRTMLLDLASGRWSEEACGLFGLDAADQPRIAANAEVVGETSAFGATVPVSALIVDQQAALFAESCFALGEAKCTYGTGAFILANAGDDPVIPPSGLAACVAWEAQGRTTYCLDGQVYTAGAAIGWLRKLGLLRSPKDLERLAGREPPGADAPLFVPALAGLGAPFWAPGARGGWVGLSLASDAEALLDAVLWGIAAQVASLAAAMAEDLGRPLEALRVDGGLTRSRRLMQAQADLCQVPVELYPSADATALGVGALARLGAGGASGPAEAVGEWRPSAVFEPRIAQDHAHELLTRFASAARALIDVEAR